MLSKLRKLIDEGFDPLDKEMLEEHEEDFEPMDKPITQSKPIKPLNRKKYALITAVTSVIMCLALIILLLDTVSLLPHFGMPDTLVDGEVASFYIENGLKDTGAVNIITPIILSYRGFDTLGESHVLFIAVCSVIILLRNSPTDMTATLQAYAYRDDVEEPHSDEILKSGCRIVLPLIAVFGFYVILNGNISPGGGFSGGAILGAGLILWLSVYGYTSIRRFMTLTAFRTVSAWALVSYSIFKCYHFVTGYNGWESIFSIGTPGTIFSGGMLLFLNIFVGMTVACTMYAMFTLFRKGDF